MVKSMVDILKFSRDMAYGSGAIMRRYWKRPVAARKKANGTWVSEVDLRISRYVCEQVAVRFPEFGLLTEETCDQYKPKVRGFIVDELDGTHTFLNHGKGFTFQMAYVDDWDQILMGLIYDPIDDVMVWGVKGQGAWISRMGHVSQLLPPTDRAWDELRFGHHRYRYAPSQWKLYQQLGVQPHQIIPTGSIGSKGLTLATGKVDAIIGLYRHIPVWDWSPGSVILQELGFATCHFDGHPLHPGELRTPHAFGYLVCPEAHKAHFLQEFAWLANKFPFPEALSSCA
ncbi:MAG: inositol monophosphatase family protein [Bacteroidota bacterium]